MDNQTFFDDSGTDLAALFASVAVTAVALPVAAAAPAPTSAEAQPAPKDVAVGASLAAVLTGLEAVEVRADDTAPGDSSESAEVGAQAGRVVMFSAGGTTYGVRVPEIVEVGRIPAITPVPHLPVWVRGVTNLRGDVVSVIDLAALCGMPSTPAHSGRMLVARDVDEDLTVGILVDRVHEIAPIAEREVHQAAAPLDGPLSPYMRGVRHRDQQVVVMLDMIALLRSTDVRQFEDLRDESTGS